MDEKNTKINYYQKSQIEIDKIVREGKRPTIALHACCGPCSTYPLEFLAPFFDITILYPNSNIYPSEEYFRRLNELKKYIEIFNKENGYSVKLVEFEYKNEEFNKKLEIYKDEPEGGKRCFLCFTLRMDEAYKYADELGFDYVTTVMTISRQKNSQVLNKIGNELSAKYKTKYFYSDFKKKNGINRSYELRRKYNLYNQQYCGCVYSYAHYLKKIEGTKEN